MKALLGLLKAFWLLIYKGMVILVRAFTTHDPVQERPTPEADDNSHSHEGETGDDDEGDYTLPDAIEEDQHADDR